MLNEGDSDELVKLALWLPAPFSPGVKHQNDSDTFAAHLTNHFLIIGNRSHQRAIPSKTAYFKESFYSCISQILQKVSGPFTTN